MLRRAVILVLVAMTVVNAPAAASTCDPPDEFVEVRLEELTIDGAEAPTNDGRGRLQFGTKLLDGEDTCCTGAYFVRTDRSTEFYVVADR